MLNLLRKSGVRKQEAHRLYGELVTRSRAPVFFRDFGVADTIDGRFDMVALHGWLVLTELKALGRDAAVQALIDTIFIGFDEAMREQGTGDMGMGRKMKAFADAFYGRLSAYDGAADVATLADALARNVYRGAATDDRARILAAYAFAARERVQQSLPDALDFGPLPTI
jgi:cytochrome b pre-mRNA-processing protein 3